MIAVEQALPASIAARLGRPRRSAGAGAPPVIRHRFTTCDHLHDLVDGLIRDGGGSGFLCQFSVRFRRPLGDPAALGAAWTRLGERVGLLCARMGGGYRTRSWLAPAAGDLRLEIVPGSLARLARAEWDRGLDPRRGIDLRLALATDAVDPGVVLTWDHRLLDARAAELLLAELSLADRADAPGDDWRAPGYRGDPAEAAGSRWGRARARAGRTVRLAAGAMALMAPELRRPLLKPHGAALAATPLRTALVVLGADTARCDARQRAATGSFHPTAFLFACVAGALESAYGVGGDIHIDCSVDQRTRSSPRRYANALGTLVLCIPGGVASRDLGDAGRAFIAAHHAWLARGGPAKLAALTSCLRWTGGRFARRQLGLGAPGVAARCTVACTGSGPLQGSWFGTEIAGVNHAVAITGSPGLGVLFHRDARGLVATVIAAGAVGERLPPERFAAILRQQLLDRPFASARA